MDSIIVVTIELNSRRTRFNSRNKEKKTHKILIENVIVSSAAAVVLIMRKVDNLEGESLESAIRNSMKLLEVRYVICKPSYFGKSLTV